jgi:Transglycosylase
VLFLRRNDHTPWRKLEDAAVALKLEGRYSKERILAAYRHDDESGCGPRKAGMRRVRDGRPTARPSARPPRRDVSGD